MAGNSSRRSTDTEDTFGDNIRVLGMLFLYSMLMFSMPFGAFYGAKYFLLTYVHVTGFVNTVWSVVAAVATMYAIILTYAYKAYREDAQENAARQARSELDNKNE